MFKRGGSRAQRARPSSAIEALEGRRLLSTVVVNTAADQADPAGSGTVSLRDAVAIANAAASDTTITFDPVAFAAPRTVTLGGTALTLDNGRFATTIVGPAAGLTVNADGKSSVFVTNEVGSVTLSNLTITGGYTPSYGGGINNQYSTLVLTDDTIVGNHADDVGGGINTGGPLTMTNVTVTGNTSSSTGGGLWDENDRATLTNVTITGNTAARAGGLANNGASMTIANTIVAGNTATATGPDATGSFASAGHNLIGAVDGSSGWVTADLTGTAAAPLDPRLGSLADNGGPTQTLLPLAGSPAIGGGSVALIPAGTVTDQRGYARTVHGAVDIGAAQSGSAPAAPGRSLSFATPPANAALGAALAPIVVDVELGGNLLATDASDVTLAIASGPAGATLVGTTTVAAVGGVATFAGLSLATAGTYALSATDPTGAVVVSGAFAVSVVKSIGALDPTFGTGGLASHDVGFAATTGVAADGTQSVLVGPVGTSPSRSFGVTRYNADGSLDATFGTAGVATTPFAGADAAPSAVAVLADGDILVAGTATSFANGTATGSQFAVAEYTPAGTLDASFGTGGQAVVRFGTGNTTTNDVLRALAVGPGGVIYLGGRSDAAASGNTDLAVAALTPTGALDAAFGTGGTTLADVAGGGDSVNALAVQPDGSVVAAGSAEVGGASEVALARFLPTGTLDPRFGNKGLVTDKVGGVYDAAASVALGAKGLIVVGGLTATGTGTSLSSDFLVQRYTSAGKPDRTFGTAGTATTGFGQPAAVTQVLVQADGSVVASGKTAATLAAATGGELDVAIARYTARGTPDAGFNRTGRVVVSLAAGAVGTATPGLLRAAAAAAVDLGAAFDAFTSSQQGVVAVTTGGEILTAGNDGANTVEAELVAAGVDLVAKLLASLPASALGGLKGTATVTITETGTTKASGTVTVTVAFASDTAGTGAVTVKTLATKVNLGQGQSKAYRLPFAYPSGLASGSYYLVATVTNGAGVPADLDAGNNAAASASAVQIAPPFVSLTGSALAAASPFVAGKAATISITVADGGNVPAKGKADVAVYLSTDGTLATATQVGDPALAVGLSAGKSRVYKLKVALPSTVAAGTYTLLAVVDPDRSLGSTDASVGAPVVGGPVVAG